MPVLNIGPTAFHLFSLKSASYIAFDVGLQASNDHSILKPTYHQYPHILRVFACLGKLGGLS